MTKPFSTIAFTDSSFSLKPFMKQIHEGNDWHLDVTHNEIKPGKAYTNIGFWDLFRTSFPLFSLVYPDYYRHFLEGFLNTYKDTGFLPKWLAPDERGMMPGTLIDGVFADAVTKRDRTRPT